MTDASPTTGAGTPEAGMLKEKYPVVPHFVQIKVGSGTKLLSTACGAPLFCNGLATLLPGKENGGAVCDVADESGTLKLLSEQAHDVAVESLLDVRGTYTLVRISKGEDGAETLETFVTEVVVPAVPAVSGSKTKDSEGNEVEVAEVPEVPATGVEEDGVTPKKVEVKVSR